MEQQRLWIAVAVAMAMMVLPFHCLATDYTVGDSSGWTLGVVYTTWASGKTFAVGDKLVFKYTPGTHNTLVVNKAAYDSCLITNPLATHNGGNDTITLDSTGAKYYICGITGHCSAGMKLTITVGAATTSKSNGTAPSPSPAPSPTTTKSNVTAPSPSPAATTSKSNGTAASPSPAPSPTTTKSNVRAPSPSPTRSPSSATPPTPSASSPSPSSVSPTTPTASSPSPSSTVSTPPESTNGASSPSGSGTSAAAPSYRMGGVLLLGGSLLVAMASL